MSPCHFLLCVVVCLFDEPAEAAVRHTDVSLNTYVDFANNGRYFAVVSEPTMGILPLQALSLLSARRR
ncbi:MAG: hypothetical protein IJE66_03755 [Akkermansia sp.]|nr:hypothetical protein [Akkermansia sp.]